MKLNVVEQEPTPDKRRFLVTVEIEGKEHRKLVISDGPLVHTPQEISYQLYKAVLECGKDAVYDGLLDGKARCDR